MTSLKRLINQNLSEMPVYKGTLDVASVKGLLGKDDPVILEIGANCGQTTIEFIKHFPNATIHCFEPEPRAIRKFKRFINHPNVFLHEVAVGNTNGTVEFHQSSGAESIDPEGWDHSGSIKPPKAHLEMYPWVKFENKITVPIIKLDDWAKDNDLMNIDFIWADVQGAESDLILGAKKTLRSTRFIYTEYYDNECYSGQIDLKSIYDLLNSFLILRKFENDVLLENFFANKSLPLEMFNNFYRAANESSSFNDFCIEYGANPEFILNWNAGI
jgi:FkbM family methyltransferase